MASTLCRRRAVRGTVAVASVFLLLLVAIRLGDSPVPPDERDDAYPRQPHDALVRDALSGITESGYAESVEEYESPLAVQEAAEEAVVRYRDRGDCIVARAGYLDLFGRTWGCVMQGCGWVDVCVVSQSEGEQTSTVKTVRMEVADWERVYGRRE